MTLVASNGSYTLDLTLHNIHKDPVIVEASSASGASTTGVPPEAKSFTELKQLVFSSHRLKFPNENRTLFGL